MRGRGRLLASTALAAAAAAGWLGLAQRAPAEDPDDAETEAIYNLQVALQAFEDRKDSEEPPEDLEDTRTRAHAETHSLWDSPYAYLFGDWNDTRVICLSMRDEVPEAFWGLTCEDYNGVVLHGIGDDPAGVRVHRGQAGLGNIGNFGWGGTEPGARHRLLGRLPGERIRLRTGTVRVSGRLAPEVVQRMVREQLPRIRACYANGLRYSPNLMGRISARFVIDRRGEISNLSNGGSDMPDGGVVSCVIRTFYSLRFPPPESGIVTVTYPLTFDHEGDTAMDPVR
jgi:hypothetical protein